MTLIPAKKSKNRRFSARKTETGIEISNQGLLWGRNKISVFTTDRNTSPYMEQSSWLCVPSMCRILMTYFLGSILIWSYSLSYSCMSLRLFCIIHRIMRHSPSSIFYRRLTLCLVYKTAYSTSWSYLPHCPGSVATFLFRIFLVRSDTPLLILKQKLVCIICEYNDKMILC